MNRHTIKIFISNYFITLSLNIIVLAIVAVVLRAQYIFTMTILEFALVHLFIHFAREFISYLTIENDLLEGTTQFFATLLIVLGFGYFFNWFDSVPIWICILMVVFVYAFGCILNVSTINKDLDFINKQLKLRNNKEVDNN